MHKILEIQDQQRISLLIQFDLGLLELDVDVSLNRYLKEKTKTEKAFSPIDCAINGKITIFL